MDIDGLDNVDNAVNLLVSSKRMSAKVIVNVNQRSVRMISCTNLDVCFSNRVLLNGICPPYCPVIVAAKEYAIWKRKPKMKVQELETLDGDNN
jgi:hypothetical protein